VPVSVIRVIVLALLLAAPRPAESCIVDAVTGVGFGSYDVLAAQPTTSSGSITLKCLVGLSVTVDLGPGNTGTLPARKLERTGGGGTLIYNLFFDSARTQIWGNGGSGTAHYGPALALVATIVLPVYGAIAARQDVPLGSYTDSVVITVNY
jgi:spore coat protein U-like protein